MENNQEHKIDKIFRETFENQETIPPLDAWIGIQTYTIGQEEKKPKVWLKYASLVIILLLFSGLGLWYYVDNQGIGDINTSVSLSQKVVSGHTDYNRKTALDNADRVLNPASVSTQLFNSKIKTKLLSINEKESKIKVQNLISNEENLISQIDKNTASIIEKKDDDLENDDIKLGESISDFEDNKIEFFRPKPLILNDLIDKIQNENENKIVALEEDLVDIKAIYKTDSTVYGNKFSLRHPIITFRLGLFTNFVNMSDNNGGEIPFSGRSINSNNISVASATFGLAWKLNDRSKISLNFNYCTYSSLNLPSKNAAAYIDPLAQNNKPTGTFKYNASKGIYEYLTPFGFVTRPVDLNSSATPNDFNANLYGSVTVWQIGTNYEYDFISIKSKKGIPALQLYGLAGVNFQGALKYRYRFFKFRNFDPAIDDFFVKYPDAEQYIEKKLGNSSSIIIGYNLGLGTRFQLSKRFGMIFSVNYDGNVSSWVHDLPFTTRISVLSAHSGFFINL